MRRPILVLLAVSTLFALASPGGCDPLELRVSPLIDLHYWVRKVASQKESPKTSEPPAVPGLPAAVEAVRVAGASLGDPGLWGVLDGSLVEATTAEELSRVAAGLPETFKARDGRSIPTRQALTGIAAAYAPLEKSFLAGVWPRHREIAERAAAVLRREFLPKATEVYADLSRHLGLPVPASPIPVYLVAEAPFPGAFTFRSQGGPFSVVALEGEPDSQWVEIVIHESIHALDVRAGERSVLADLRRRLGQVPGASPVEVHDFVHTLMFAQAAGTVRRVLDPGHKDYGDVDGYYAKVPKAAAVLVPAWRDYLEGRITRDVALEKIVAGFAASVNGVEKEKGGPQAAPVKPPSGDF